MKEIDNDVFSVLPQAWVKKFWVLMRNQTSDLRIPRPDALPLSHRDSAVSVVCYKVYMKRVLHTARISNVDRLMFVDRWETVSFELGKEIENEVFIVSSRAWDKEKILSPSEESNLRPSDSALQCSTAEPQMEESFR